MSLKRFYWVATVRLAAMYVAGGTLYLTNMAMVQGVFGTLGYGSGTRTR